MDPLRIAVRVGAAFVLLLVLVRLSGKHTVRQGSAFDFTVALIIGDMVDDMLWAESNVGEFVVGAGVLFTLHTLFDTVRYHAGARR
jgi:uncharacterized membrane protein YcaP (DUF421 family)